MITLNPYPGILREQQKLLLRAAGWRSLRNEFIRVYPACAACGLVHVTNQVHHVFAVQFYPDLELVWANLVTLCCKHHLDLGHGGNWKHWNQNVIEVCQLMQAGVSVEKRDLDVYAYLTNRVV